ncbi:sensor histidine kinase [Anaerocolumna xylanovorans]|uniref:HAMP domain-containing protein n=1 Tax=Anaerocolumna xylanovorans DSM 12503 TaxID=1121345 RepID=A0A1M7XY23_9FIRM|nr:histidine kinase [Anaerocolumna xylanovorans]SHO43904.1 HAMP domain-containing protein [Anaerocolumna xylanovorans DSM 12503]
MRKKNIANRINIKSKMMSMVVIAILVPLACLIFFSAFYQKEVIEQKRKAEVESQMKYALGLSVQRFHTAIKLSKDITYEEKIEEYAELLQKNKINESLSYKLITAALKDKFYLSNEILFTAVLLEANKDQIYSITADGYHEIDHYIKSVHPYIEEQTKDLGSGVCIYVRDKKIYIIRNLISTKNFKKFGVIINQVDTKKFFKELLSNETFKDWIEVTINHESFQLQDEYKDNISLENKLLTFHSGLEDEQVSLACNVKIEKEKLIQEETFFVRGVTISVFLIILCISFVLFQTYASIVGPIVELTGALKEVEQGNWGLTLASDREDELGVLMRGFNEMSLKIEYLIDCVYKEELNLKEAKIKALQSQINPHFVNNTLEIINWKAQMIGGTEISKMIRALSVIMLATLNRNNKKMVTLIEEISYMDSYLYILKRRFEDRITIVKEIEEELLECEVPILIIQPLLENAVVHGIEPAKGGKIIILIKKTEEEILISIANDGKLLTKEEEERIVKMLCGEVVPNKQHSVGIGNVNERIKLIYGSRYGLTISKNQQSMTESVIRIPLTCTNNSKKQQVCPVENQGEKQ